MLYMLFFSKWLDIIQLYHEIGNSYIYIYKNTQKKTKKNQEELIQQSGDELHDFS